MEHLAEITARAVPGRAVRVAPGLRLLRAPNPSAMTHTGTNTWILGAGRVAVIDPGPALPAHLAALRAALDPDERVARILVTHAHRDHSGLAPALARACGAPVAAAGEMAGRRRPAMAQLGAEGLAGGGEGVDAAFVPDETLEDGDEVAGPGWRVRVLATPGHTADHVAFLWDDAAFSGDHVMGWASSLISPPDGDLVAFLESCARLRGAGARVLHPGHGPSVPDPAARIDALVAHRRAREASIVDRLASEGPATAADLARAIYSDVTPALLPAAERNVLAHLLALVEAGRARAEPGCPAHARYALAPG